MYYVSLSTTHKLPPYVDPQLFYTQQQKKRENVLLSNWLKMKYIEFKKCMLHVKLTV